MQVSVLGLCSLIYEMEASNFIFEIFGGFTEVRST